MRKLLVLLSAALLVVGVAGVAGAAPLKWEGTLKIELGTLPTAFATGTGVATVNNSSGLGHLSTIRLTNAFEATELVPVTDPETTSTNGIVLVIASITNVSGTLGGISGGGSLSPSTLPIKGVARVCLLSTACNPGGFLPLVLTSHTTGTGTQGVGVGGLLTIGSGGAIRISLQANPWTLGQGTSLDQTDNGSLTTYYSTGFAHGPASLTSSTAAPSGVVKFISPLQVTTNITSGSSAVLKLFSSIKLHFVPEPGMVLLLGSGVVGLVLLGRHRMKR
jgi:hypothetical protein